LTLFSCKKHPVDPAAPPHNDTFSALVDGKPFAGDSYQKYFMLTNELFMWVEDNANGKSISLTLSDYDGVKRFFNLNDPPQTYGGYAPHNLGPIYTYFSNSKSGQFNIDSVDKTTYKPDEVINGSFQFETDDAVGKFSITNGRFSLLIHR
jgi:hypothetical protein